MSVLNALRRRWWLICFTLVIALAVALVPLYFTPPVYKSTAKFIVTPAKKLEANRELLDSVNPNNIHAIASTFAEVLTSDNFFKQATGQLHLSDSDSNAFRRSTVILPETAVVQLVVEGRDSQSVADLANVLGQLAIEYANGTYRIYEFEFIGSAIAPSAPIPSPWMRNLLLALVLGVASGTLSIFLWEQFLASRKISPIIA